VPDTATGGGLADHLAHWAPPAVEMSRQVDPGSSAAFAALIDAAPPALGAGTPLPPVWHWFTLLDHPATSAIGADGHQVTAAWLGCVCSGDDSDPAPGDRHPQARDSRPGGR
jgi:3-methylfumaryl-CoA hydratase